MIVASRRCIDDTTRRCCTRGVSCCRRSYQPANYGINTFTDVTVANSGTITGIASMAIVSFNGAVTWTNTITGKISGGVGASTRATVTNSGSIAGRVDADNVTVTNLPWLNWL